MLKYLAQPRIYIYAPLSTQTNPMQQIYFQRLLLTTTNLPLQSDSLAPVSVPLLARSGAKSDRLNIWLSFFYIVSFHSSVQECWSQANCKVYRVQKEWGVGPRWGSVGAKWPAKLTRQKNRPNVTFSVHSLFRHVSFFLQL